MVREYVPNFDSNSDTYSYIIAGVLMYCNPHSEAFKREYLDIGYWESAYGKFVKGGLKTVL